MIEQEKRARERRETSKRREPGRGERRAREESQGEERDDSLFTDLGEVYKGSFLGAHADHLGRFHHQFLLLPPDHLGVLLTHDIEHPL